MDSPFKMDNSYLIWSQLRNLTYHFSVAIDDYLYHKAKKQEQSEYYKEVREAIRFNNPEPALKPKRKRTLI